MSLGTKIREFLTKSGLPFQENERSIITSCPQCGKDNKLYLFREKGYGKCFKCGTSFSAAALVVALTGCTYPDAFKILEVGEPVHAGERLFFNEGVQQEKKKVEVQHINLPGDFFSYHRKLAKPGVDYLLERGCWLHTIGYYNIHYCPYMKRVIFPLWSGGGYVGWQGRDISGEAELRYLTSKGFSKGKFLMGYENIKTDRVSHVILTEGPVDCMRVAILRNAVCSMGKLVSHDQLELLRQRKDIDTIYLALDPDAFEVFDFIASELKPDKKVYLMQPPAGRKDFGECTDVEILKSFKEAKPYVRNSMLSGEILK